MSLPLVPQDSNLGPLYLAGLSDGNQFATSGSATKLIPRSAHETASGSEGGQSRR